MCISQATLDFGQIHWSFLWGILIAKSAVFVLIIVATLSLDHKHSNNILGNAGLRGMYPCCVDSPVMAFTPESTAIFCTQSNDFAMGLPILEAVFKESHPSYVRMSCFYELSTPMSS